MLHNCDMIDLIGIFYFALMENSHTWRALRDTITAHPECISLSLRRLETGFIKIAHIYNELLFIRAGTVGTHIKRPRCKEKKEGAGGT